MTDRPTVIILDNARVMGYNVSLAHHLGINAAILFHQLDFWSGKTGRTDGWFYKSNRELSDETALTPKQLVLAVNKLKQAEFIETKLMRAEGHATTHFHLLKTLNTTITKRSNVSSLVMPKGQTISYAKRTNYTMPKGQTITEDNHKITHKRETDIVVTDYQQKQGKERYEAMKRKYGLSK